MLLDTFAWIEDFQGSAKGRGVGDRLDASPIVYTSPMVLAEVYSKVARVYGSDEADRRVAFVLRAAAVIEPSAELGVAAGRIHHEMKGRVEGFGMADAFILAAARSRKARVLTGDPHFAGVPDAEML